MKNITILKERDSYENGVTCLAMIFMYHGFDNIRNSLKLYTNAYCSMATSLFDIKNTAQKLGFEAMAYKFQQNQNTDRLIFERQHLPCIVFFQDSEHKRNAFMIVYKESNGYIWGIDTIKGKVRISLSDFYTIWHHIMINITPTKESFKTKQSIKLFEQFQKREPLEMTPIDYFINKKNNFIKEIGNSEKIIDVVIIGGGPSGVHCGIQAQKSGLSFIILDKNSVLGELKKYPKEMIFVSEIEDFQVKEIPFKLTEENVKTSNLVNYYDSIVKRQGLPVNCNENVTSITKLAHGFSIHSSRSKYFALNIIIATGGDIDRALDIPGINLPKVSRSFTEAYNNPKKYSNSKVTIIGGGISAVSLAAKLCKNNVKVNIIHRDSVLKWTVNPVIKVHFPEVDDYLKKRILTINYSTKLQKVEKEKIQLKNEFTEEKIYIDNDYVFLMIGKEPSNLLLHDLKIEISKHCPYPILNPDTLETSQQGVFVTGSAFGQAVFRHFENHALKIVSEIHKRLQTKSTSK